MQAPNNNQEPRPGPQRSSRRITLEESGRVAHFNHFRAYSLPYTSITAPVDVTQLVSRCRAREQSVFGAMLFAIVQAANSIPQLRQRIEGEDIVEYAVIDPAFTALDQEENLYFCDMTYSARRDVFLERVRAAKKVIDIDSAPESNPEAKLDADLGRTDRFFISALPWIAFTSLQHPAQTHSGDSVPRISWGKFTGQPDALQMPLNLQVHHALVDGLHMARFFQAAQVELDRDW